MIGLVVKSHGIRGEVCVGVTTDDPVRRFAVSEVLTGRQGGKEKQVTVQSVRPHQGRLLIKFEEINDRTAADSLRSMAFWAPPFDSDEDDDTFYDHQLTGLKVRQGEVVIGEVVDVSSGPAGTLLGVRLNEGKQVLVPFVYDIVPEVNIEGGYCLITPPDGLLEL